MSIPITRRRFLGTASLATVAGCAGRSTGGGGEGSPIVDCHVHCFAGPDDPRFPYHERAPYRPDKPATPARLLRLMDKAGVNYAVVVHPEPYQDDHRYQEHCLDVGKGRLKGTCLFFAGDPDSGDRMARLAKRGDIVALRIHAFRPDRLPPFGRPELRELWKRAADLGLAIQLHFRPNYAAGFEPLIRAFPDTTVIIDHLGRPFQQEEPGEHDRVMAWSRFKNTVMKVSSLSSTFRNLEAQVRPIVRRVCEAWGPDRMIFGGGFSSDATAESYRGEQDLARRLLAHLSASDQDKVLGGTAARLFELATRGCR